MTRPAPRTHSVALACLALSLPVLACAPDPGADGAEAAGGDGGAAGELVDFTLPDLEGRPVTLSDHRGKTVILDFWATWCPPCIFQVPELNAFWEANRDSGEVMVIGVAVDVEGAEVVAPWAEEQGVAYQLVIGTEDLAREFGAMGFPTLVIVKPSGEIDSRHVGLIEAAELDELVASVAGTSAT